MAKAVSKQPKKATTAKRNTSSGACKSSKANKTATTREMSKSDKITLKAWKHTYENRDKRVA